MNEEEKKAVERIEDTFYSDLGKGINKFQKITLYEDGIRDVNILLNLLEKLQKENEELKESNKKLYEIGQEMCKQDKYTSENYILVQKIKDKLEELNQYYKKEIYPILYQWSDITITEHYDEMIELLQELLGDE